MITLVSALGRVNTPRERLVELISDPVQTIFNQVVVQSLELDAVFHALANQARRSMLLRLADAELSVGELAAPLHMSLAAASKHLGVLERAGLVRRSVLGRRHVMRLEPRALADAETWLRFAERTWRDQLAALDAVLTTEES